MSRYIDADAYAAEMKTRQDACRELIYAAQAEDNEEIYDRQSCAFGVFVEAKLTLDAMPTVDAVPVVRCGECKYFIRINEEGGECDLYHQSHWIKFYCADGEREDADRNNSEIPNS